LEQDGNNSAAASATIPFLLISCSDAIKAITDAEQRNKSIITAVSVLESVTTDTDCSVTLSGNATVKDMLVFKEALVALEYRGIGTGYLSIDMTGLSGVTELDPQYFGNLTMLKSVKLPESLKEIPKFLFYGCEFLTDVTIEENTELIGYQAFSYCYNLETLTIKSEQLELRSYAFYGSNPSFTIDAVQNLKMYYLDAPPFELEMAGTFFNYLPTDEPIHISRTFLTKKNRDGKELTVNLSIQYTSDSDCIYAMVSNDDEEAGVPRKIVALLKQYDVTLGSDVDGVLIDVPYDFNFEITVPKPTDESSWYYTSFPEVLYTSDKEKANDLDFEGNSSFSISQDGSSEYYYFKSN